MQTSLTLSDPLIPLVIATFVFAGTVKGLTGMGLPTVTLAVLSQMADPRLAIALLLAPALVTNTWQVYRSGDVSGTLAGVWPFALVMAAGIWVFSQFAAALPAQPLLIVIGAVIVLFVLTTWTSRVPPIAAEHDRAAQLCLGGIAGIMGGLTAIWSPPMVIYLLARQIPKDRFVGMMGFLILAGTVPLTLGYWKAGLFTPPLMAISATMILPCFAGFALGERLRAKLDAGQFRRALLMLFILMGANLIRRGLTG